ncbi:FKBP-type peptidyl-prolyl cis-trans isomerase [Viscerimonas tarda]
MNKKIYILLALLFNTVIFFSSCVDSSDDNPVDEKWMLRNDTEFYAEARKPEYKKINGIADPFKYILWKDTVFCDAATIVTDPALRAAMPSPVFSDTIKCRYEGWFRDAVGNKIIFDSTENPTYFAPNTNPNKVARLMKIADLIDGWRVALYKMKEGDEWNIVIPYYLGYGLVQNGNIPQCTNLYFNLKLIEVTSKSN